MKFLKYSVLLTLTGVCLFSCAPKRKKNSQVVIHELSDPGSLNPLNAFSAEAGNIIVNLFPALLGIDYKTLEFMPVLAVSRPEIEFRKEKKGLLLTYHIRPEARFDNGTPVTAKDFEFTVKVVKNPKVDCAKLRSVYELIEDIILYPDDPLKLTVVYGDVFILAEQQSGDIPALPQYIYDPKNLMNNFTIPQLTAQKDSLANDPRIIEFAENFNLQKYQRDSAFISGTGAYALSQWETGQRVVLTRKKQWWGDNVKDKISYFEDYPEKIIYQVINDQTTALVALKSQQIDVMRGIKAKDFSALNQSENVKQNYNLYTPAAFLCYYLGINNRLPKFSDKRVRQALAHLVDEPKIIHAVFYDYAKQVVGPVHPTKTKSYNKNIALYDFNPEKAKALLADAGWSDSNGDGTIDKMIDGKRTEFSIDFSINAGNDERKAVALMFQDAAGKAGIKVNVASFEWSVYLQNQRAHNFEMYYGGWAGAPIPDDFKQIYHTASYTDGSNYFGFSNAQSDALIDSIRVELDENKRDEMTKRFQVILHEEVPCIYLHVGTEKIAIHKRFTNAEATSMRPGYRETGFMELEN